MSEPAHPHQRVPAGRDSLDRRSTRPCWRAPRRGATTRRWSTASPGRRSPTPSSRRWSTGWRPGSPRSGCSPGDVVALHSPNTVLYPVVFYAASRAGATVTTLSAMTTAKDMANQLDDSKATLVVTVGALLPVATEAAGDRPVWTCDQVEGHRSVQELLAAHRRRCPTSPVDAAEDVAVLPVLERHHEPAQGRDAHPRQHRREPAADRRRCARWARTTGSSPSCRSSTSTA